ncbi:hypothetical protein FORC53_0538 [Vibrio vulnificus]|uniref:Uncharacterized protein n=1 Tax=Vibrio vulnificus TaxID=672 RepID=A0AAN1PLN1_VIBVL|nr:hypothetical protein FORC53_0538 [Vibrio vulnificus]
MFHFHIIDKSIFCSNIEMESDRVFSRYNKFHPADCFVFCASAQFLCFEENNSSAI